MKNLIITIIGLLVISQVNGQSLSRQVIGSAGIAVQNNTAGLSSTIGEVVTASHIGSVVHLTQGFQQADEASTIGIIKLKTTGFNVSAFPNPTRNLLNIKSNLPSQGIATLQYEILDIAGRLVSSGSILSNNGIINVSHLAKANYILKLVNTQHQLNQIVRFNKM